MPATKTKKKRPIELRHVGADGLTDKQRVFAEHLVVSEDKKAAAIEAGVPPSQAGSMGCQWMDVTRHPLVVAYVGKLRNERAQRARLSADDVLGYVQGAMCVHPTDWFVPGPEGLQISQEGLASLPPEIKRLIEDMKVITRRETDDEGNESEETVVVVRLVSKTEMTKLAFKYQLGERVSVLHAALPPEFFDALAGRRSKVDLVEAKLEQAKLRMIGTSKQGS